ncbi:hypothetical protein QJS10_CPA06g00271 [Acorus calamus]|uniref:Fungal lipase-type domain-containing protein n=1 Tax=Acorus calamus TaxID=4465 RepID=A0AAV9ELV3_ACOCL|nr:hypothetical protein QJS10_CPA06g00271 [Acorus calamus]
MDPPGRLDSQWNSHWERQKIQGLLLSTGASNVLHEFLVGKLFSKHDSHRRFLSGILYRFLSQGPEDAKKKQQSQEPEEQPKQTVPRIHDSNARNWKLELDWLTKALEPALQLCRWPLTPGSGGDALKIPPSSRSVVEILSSLQKSKVGIQDWSLSDFTVGLYLVYLRQASAEEVEDVKGVQISSEQKVQDLIYHTELAKGAYKENAAGLARNSMLRERNVLKFVKASNVMRPGYYTGIDARNKLVILGIRGTHTVYDLITDMVALSDQEITFEGFSTHFGTSEAARWFLRHELGSIRNCLEKYKGFRLRLVGHSLGGAIAALLAIMLRKKSQQELGFEPEIVSAVGIGTPPCVSKELAESCTSYVSTVVLQDDIIPRLSTASIARLRNEILETDWMTVLEKEDWKSIVDLVTNAKQVVSSIQDVARKLGDYAKFMNKSDEPDSSNKKVVTAVNPSRKPPSMSEELFSPGTLYFLKKNIDAGSGSIKSRDSYTLWKRNPGEHFQRILLSSNFISDHKCDNHYYALRDVLKGLPASDDNLHS